MSKPINYKCQLSTEANCKLLLHMNEASWNGTADEVKDASGCGNHGQAFGGLTTITGGKFSRCGEFNGSSDYINCGNDPSLNITDAITIEAWVNSQAYLEDYAVIVGKGGYMNLMLAYGTTGRWRLQNASESNIIDGVFTPPAHGTWYHLAATYNSNGDWAIYIDGSPVNSGNVTHQDIKTSSTYLGIGARNSGGWSSCFNGLIDEVAIYSRAKTAEEIYQHYHKQVGVHII